MLKNHEMSESCKRLGVGARNDIKGTVVVVHAKFEAEPFTSALLLCQQKLFSKQIL